MGIAQEEGVLTMDRVVNEREGREWWGWGGTERVKNMQRGLHKKTAPKTIDGEKVDRYNTTSFFWTVEHRF